MRIVVIGGSGHIGSFLVPRLVRAGHEVVSLSRGTSTPYTGGEEWSHVERVIADREQEDRDGVFADRIARLRADVVVDLLCFTLGSATALVERLRGETGHLVGCGSVWRAGPSTSLPISEEDAPPPVGEYGIQKDRIARLLADETASGGLVTTTLHPGHISGPGWAPIGPTGNLDPAVWSTLAAGETLLVPGLGAETMHHVHADDVAQAFELAITHRDAAGGEDFFVTAAHGLNVRGYAELAAGWFGRAANLEHVSWETFREGLAPEHAEASWEHLSRSQVFSVERARRLLGYEPRYSVVDTVRESVRRLIDEGTVRVPQPMVV
ncbi:NAD-dependent epimerase/dehydratase family protein [Serinibacter arcticus]|uniref:UDP-glucose 4-epimerase n=1 Tax=Serinibacter arcticus TaxID=1655435 RepID=A0A4Z1EAZ2_9MICO|nr:NAD(P)-dependent oxidoreductase [Serinibacter arcticus]TGO06591.1 UDP-glucose 4-epimerase [Serinibacter arcticus]